MKGRISLLSAGVLACTTLMLLGPTQPAAAVVPCAGVLGNVTVTPGLLFPVLLGVRAGNDSKDHLIDVLVFSPSNVVHGFTFDFGTLGVCAHVRILPTVGGFRGTGILKGYCGHSSGTGTIGGQTFAYVSAGTFLVATGHVVGVGSVVPLPLTRSCVHAELPASTTTFDLPGGGATEFLLLAGVAVGLNCPNFDQPVGTLVLVPEQTFLPKPEIGVHVHQYVTHIWLAPPCVPDPVLP